VKTADITRITEMEDRHWWFREKRHLLADELKRLGPPGRALDIGAAGGGNTRVLRERGWDVVATDYDENAVEIARSRGLDAIHADARDLPLPSSSFDLVVAFEILEHIQEDDQAAAELFRVLRPGGSALISVPSGMDLWSAHDVAVSHVRRYDRAGLRKVIEDAGFVVDELWSWNVLLRPVVALRRRSARGNELNEHTPWLVNHALTAIVTAERYLPTRSRRGVSLILKAHKP